MGKSTISMAIFNSCSYVKLPEGNQKKGDKSDENRYF